MKLTKAQKEELLAVYLKSERKKTRLSQPVNRRLKRVLIKKRCGVCSKQKRSLMKGVFTGEMGKRLMPIYWTFMALLSDDGLNIFLKNP
ncbi:Uncharacterised protein [Pasteurella multocida]|nr:Uncharacterised protein [Pasteurella multocida]